MVWRALYLFIYNEHPQKTRPHLFNYRPVVVKRFVVQTNDFAVITSRFKVTFVPPQKKLKNKQNFSWLDIWWPHKYFYLVNETQKSIQDAHLSFAITESTLEFFKIFHSKKNTNTH